MYYLKWAIGKKVLELQPISFWLSTNFENTGLNVIVARVDSIKNELTGFEWTYA